MSLIVPALRVAMAFSNVWETYKTLKMPPPSARNGGRPTIRALSQRKRDMKSCLAVWLTFCCFTLYERFAERVISIFIPFYDELKSMVMLFLILARAKAAEPIYLHIIRPFLRPHTAALDAILEVATMIGDLIFTVATLPLQPFIMWWQARQAEADYAVDPTQDGAAALKDASVVSETVTATSAVRASADAYEVSSSISVQQARVASAIDGLPATPSHQIWHPPPSAYSDGSPTPEERFVPPHPDELDREAAAAGAPLAEQDDWRKYPDFPSAYPATPAAPAARLHPDPRAAIPPRIAEDEDEPPDEPSTDPARPTSNGGPGFRPSLRTPREDQDPHSVPSVLSDENVYLGIQAAARGAGGRSGSFGEEEYGVDEYDEEDEDSFNITLQTPMPRGGLGREMDVDAPPLPAMRVSPAAGSVLEASPARTILGPLATGQVSSQAQGVSFRATKVAGTKRAHEGAKDTSLKAPAQSRLAAPSRRPASRMRRTASAETSESATSAGTEASATDATSVASATSPTTDVSGESTASSDLDPEQHPKRRRVLSTRSGKSVAVPAPKLAATTKKVATPRKTALSKQAAAAKRVTVAKKLVAAQKADVAKKADLTKKTVASKRAAGLKRDASAMRPVTRTRSQAARDEKEAE